jgi:hypothetical protein
MVSWIPCQLGGGGMDATSAYPLVEHIHFNVLLQREAKLRPQSDLAHLADKDSIPDSRIAPAEFSTA